MMEDLSQNIIQNGDFIVVNALKSKKILNY